MRFASTVANQVPRVLTVSVGTTGGRLSASRAVAIGLRGSAG